MKVPKKYLTKNPRVMKREIKKHGGKADNDSSAYGPWDADYKSRKAGKGKRVKTKESKYTKKYKEMFGESEIRTRTRIKSLEEFDSNESTEFDINEGQKGSVMKALKKKADKSGFQLGILKQVWDRGYAAWKIGHRPGTTPEQWAFGRVNSFITGGKTTKMADKALYKKAKEARAKKKNK